MTLLSLLPLLPVIVGHIPSKPPARPGMAGKTRSACVAVTKGDVEDALGRPVGLAGSEASLEQSTCDYSAEGGQVSVTVVHSKEKLNVGAEMETLRADFPEARIRAVTGLGVRAFFLDMPAAGTQLHVVRGEHDYLMVSVLGFGEADRVSAAAEKMARTALARL